MLLLHPLSLEVLDANDAAVKAVRWREDFGCLQVVLSAVLSGVARAARGGVLIKGGAPLEKGAALCVFLASSASDGICTHADSTMASAPCHPVVAITPPAMITPMEPTRLALST